MRTCPYVHRLTTVYDSFPAILRVQDRYETPFESKKNIHSSTVTVSLYRTIDEYLAISSDLSSVININVSSTNHLISNELIKSNLF